MKLKTVLFSTLILSAVFLSAFGAPAAPQTSVRFQDTVAPPAVTPAAPTAAVTTPGAVPVTGGESPANLWTLVLFGLLGLLGIAFLVALFTPRTTPENIDRVPPYDHDV